MTEQEKETLRLVLHNLRILNSWLKEDGSHHRTTYECALLESLLPEFDRIYFGRMTAQHE